tara:strand:+ start:231 stop:770 length:540 start_codon:yes stop_codon:yes gene_type:complete
MTESNPKKLTDQPLFKPRGGVADRLTTQDYLLYSTNPDDPNTEPKVGTTTDLARRQKELGLKDHEFHKELTMPEGTLTEWEVLKIEAQTARMHGFPVEHEGNYQIALGVRVGPLGKSGNYVLTNCVTGAITTVSEAGQFERANKLHRQEISKAANPNQRRKHVNVNGIKHTVTYAKDSK